MSDEKKKIVEIEKILDILYFVVYNGYRNTEYRANTDKTAVRNDGRAKPSRQQVPALSVQGNTN
jgi:hypothetical protein